MCQRSFFGVSHFACNNTQSPIQTMQAPVSALSPEPETLSLLNPKP